MTLILRNKDGAVKQNVLIFDTNLSVSNGEKEKEEADWQKGAAASR